MVRIVVIANIVDHNYAQKRITDCASLHTESNAEHFQHLSIIRQEQIVRCKYMNANWNDINIAQCMKRTELTLPCRRRLNVLCTKFRIKPCNITSRSLIFALLSESNKYTVQQRFKVCNISYLRVLFHSSWLLLEFWYIIKRSKEMNAFMLQWHIIIGYSWSTSCVLNTLVSNHVNSDHFPSFSCLAVWNVRQATSSVYAITVISSTLVFTSMYAAFALGLTIC